VAANPRLEHRLGDRDGQHVVFARLEAAKPLREDSKSTLDGRFDYDL
jgi:hypothetical protein